MTCSLTLAMVICYDMPGVNSRLFCGVLFILFAGIYMDTDILILKDLNEVLVTWRRPTVK